MGEIYSCACLEDDRTQQDLAKEERSAMQQTRLNVELIMNGEVIMSTAGRSIQRIWHNLRYTLKNDLQIFSYYRQDDLGKYHIQIDDEDDLKRDWQYWKQYQEGDQGFKLLVQNGETSQNREKEGAELSDFWIGEGGSTAQ